MSSRPTRFAAPSPRTRAASPTSPRAIAPRHRASMQPRFPQSQRRPVQLDDLVAELPRPGPRAPVHAAADHQPGAESRPEVQVREGPALTALSGHRQSEGRRVGVLVDDDRHAEPPHQRVPQREPVPLGEPGDPVQDAPGVVERPGQGGADAEEGADGRRAAVSRDRPRPPATSPATSRATAPTTASAPAPRSSGDRRPPIARPVRSTTTAWSSSRSRWTPTACPASGTSRSTVRGLPPVEARRPASAARPSLPQPGRDLADGLGGQPGALGEFEAADAVRRRPCAAGRAPARRCGCAGRAGSRPPHHRPPLYPYRNPYHRPRPHPCPSRPSSCSRPPLSSALALWQQRCESGGHD